MFMLTQSHKGKTVKGTLHPRKHSQMVIPPPQETIRNGYHRAVLLGMFPLKIPTMEMFYRDGKAHHPVGKGKGVEGDSLAQAVPRVSCYWVAAAFGSSKILRKRAPFPRRTTKMSPPVLGGEPSSVPLGALEQKACPEPHTR